MRWVTAMLNCDEKAQRKRKKGREVEKARQEQLFRIYVNIYFTYYIVENFLILIYSQQIFT